MRYLLIVATVLILVFTLTIVGTRSIGEQARASVVTLLDPGDCSQPCWRGIQPGKTTFDEARALLNADAVWDDTSYDSTGRLVWEMKSPEGWRGSALRTRNPRTDTIQSLELTPPKDTLKLGDMVTSFADPIRLRHCDRSNSDHIHLFFEGDIEVVAVNAEGGVVEKLDPDLTIRTIRYYSADSSSFYNTADWQGFVRKDVLESC